MKVNDKDWSIIDVFNGFFPVQIIFYHLRYNLVSLFCWTLLFAIVSKKVAYSFGIPFLFLSPEYLGEVSAYSFLLVGFALGGFTVGFNTYSYMKLGSFFPFLTTLSKPFFLFSINNSLIPISFYITYLYQVASFQMNQELASKGDIFLYLGSILLGSLIFFILSLSYFSPLSKRAGSYTPKDKSEKPISSVIHKKEKWFRRFNANSRTIYIYIGRGLKFTTSRSTSHFDQAMVEKVFARNRVNASIFELLTISVFFLLGLFNSTRFLEVPAAASIVLLITITLMLFSALYSWLKNWVYPIIIIVVFGMNYMSKKTDMFHYRSYAFGLDYSKKVSYSLDDLKKMNFNDSLQQSSFSNYTQILNNWKTKTKQEKPKLIIINTSGGGSRSALWTTHVLHELDKKFNYSISNQTQMITGASGGMVGAAFYRELLLSNTGKQISNKEMDSCRNMIAQDLLNRLAFMASTNDIFVRYQRYDYEGHSYTKDRGYAFEAQLNENTGNIMDHNLGYYKSPEFKGTIPVMIFSPTIVNDGRRLILSSQNLHFLTYQDSSAVNGYALENIDAHSLFNNQNVNQVKFSSVLRASATFPFVLPMIAMPTKPEIQLMDAGIRDNYGTKITMLYLQKLQGWISENTSGVIIIQVRDNKKTQHDEHREDISFFDKISLPFGNMYKNFPSVQDYNQEEMLNLSNLPFDLDFVTFNLIEKNEDRVSLSWHLTMQERQKVINALNSETNKKQLSKLEQLIK